MESQSAAQSTSGQASAMNQRKTRKNPLNCLQVFQKRHAFLREEGSKGFPQKLIDWWYKMDAARKSEYRDFANELQHHPKFEWRGDGEKNPSYVQLHKELNERFEALPVFDENSFELPTPLAGGHTEE